MAYGNVISDIGGQGDVSCHRMKILEAQLDANGAPQIAFTVQIVCYTCA